MIVMKPDNDFSSIHNMLVESLAAKAILFAVELQLFDELSGKEMALDDIASLKNLVPERLEPVMEILVDRGLIELHNDAYCNSDIANEFLVTASRFYQGDAVRLTMQFNGEIENSLYDLIAGGEVDRERTDKQWAVESVMEGTAQDALAGGLIPVVEFVSSLPDFATFRKMCDIGGNHGLYSMGLLEKNPNLQSVIYDLPEVVKAASERCRQMGFGERITTYGLDFRTSSLPESGYDLAFTSHVLYAFKERLPGTLLKISKALKPGGWFVSHHYARESNDVSRLTKASLELLTRLCGYPSHYIEIEEFALALSIAEFRDIRVSQVSEDSLSLIVAGRKPEV